MTGPIRAPFPWFGGKRRVADVVWRAFDPRIQNYIEPFAGSAAVLLGRPGGAGKIETINDIDRYVANFWRAITADPWAVAEWADGPVNEADLHARHLWLVNQTEFRERMHADPDYFDAKIAGWWVHGLCAWIGGGWCAEPKNHKRPRIDGIGKGVHSNAGHQKRPVLAGDNAGRGVHSDSALHAAYSPGRRPAISSAGSGVHLPSLGNNRGIHGVSAHAGTFLHTLEQLTVPDAPPCFEWFARLALRLRRVRVACGDWTRVLGPSVLGKGKNVGGRRPCAVFLDPPYDPDLRCRYLYTEDDPAISAQVREWAIEHGDDPDLRIALCGYEGEHAMPSSWREYAWTAARGYAAEGNVNRSKERIWFSPHCLPLEGPRQASLFEVANG